MLGTDDLQARRAHVRRGRPCPILWADDVCAKGVSTHCTLKPAQSGGTQYNTAMVCPEMTELRLFSCVVAAVEAGSRVCPLRPCLCGLVSPPPTGVGHLLLYCTYQYVTDILGPAFPSPLVRVRGTAFQCISTYIHTYPFDT